ncbi:MAG: cytochrome c, partial [Thauera sp.]
MPRPQPARLLLPALALALLAACSAEVPDIHPDKPVTQRRDAFKALLRSSEPMGTMIADRRFDPGAFARLAEGLVAVRDKPWGHFGPDTDYPPTKARRAVWEKPAEFERRRADFIAATERVLAAAAARSEGDARTAVAALQDSCKACHR